MNTRTDFEQFQQKEAADTAPVVLPSTFHVWRLARTSCILMFFAVAAAACTSANHSAEEVQSSPPEVSYEYTTDEGLIAANAKAREFCSQYSSSPTIRGSITQGSGDTKIVTFECLKVTQVLTPTTPVQVYSPPTAPPRGYTYYSDADLLHAVQSADAFCARTGQTASSSITTNPDGVKVLTFQCVP
jgi:hypothetical protein